MNKPKKKKKRVNLNLLVCRDCGSKNVSMEAWINVNTNKYVDDMGTEAQTSCENCQSTDGVVTLKEYKQNKLDDQDE